MCVGLELLFLVAVVMACGGEGLWEGLRLDGGLEVGCDGVFPEGEVEGGGMRCQPAGSPPCASFSALKGALWDWSETRRKRLRSI